MSAGNGTPDSREDSFKAQLDQAAVDQRERDNQPKPNPIVEKITEYVPAAAKILGPKQHVEEEKPAVPGPPERPYHDDQIEGFVRDQHKSKKPGGDLSSVAKE